MREMILKARSSCCRATAFRTRTRQDGAFVHDHCGIFDEHGIRQIRLRGEYDDVDPVAAEGVHVGAVLHLGEREIDPLSRQVGQLAVAQRS